MRISDWSSDVCSSDLGGGSSEFLIVAAAECGAGDGSDISKALSGDGGRMMRLGGRAQTLLNAIARLPSVFASPTVSVHDFDGVGRAEERRVGKECVRSCRSRWSPYD